MPPAATIHYYPSPFPDIPSPFPGIHPSSDFDHSRLVEWLRRLDNPSQIEEALLWFLEQDVTSREFSIGYRTPQFTDSSGIAKLPNEILTVILDYSIDLKIPRVILQLVNKHWYAIMQAPSLWNNMTLELSRDGQYVYASNRLVYLRQCLQRSGSVALDVKILIHEPQFNGTKTLQIPFELILPRCYTKNWRTLVFDLRCLSDVAPVLRPDDFGGLEADHFFLPSLKSLVVSADKLGVFVFSGKNTTNSEGPNPIPKIVLPEQIFNGRGFAHLTSLRTFEACTKAVSMLSSCLNLRELHASMKLSGYAWMSASIQFPPIMTIPPTSTQALRALRMNRVQHLTIEELSPNLLLQEISIPFPELQVLTIENSDFRSLIYISAPKLRELYISNRRIPRLDTSTNAADTITLLRHLPQYIKVAPKILHTRLPMTTEATMLLLELWPQLEQASIRLVDSFDWNWLVEGLVKRKRVEGQQTRVMTSWKYCPHLLWLKLVIDGPEGKRGEWEDHARAILRGRKDSLLTCVSWTYGISPEIVLNREDLDT
jgi:F-box-like